MPKIEITELVKVQPALSMWLKKICGQILKYLNIKKELSLVLVGDKEIKKLNYQYRHKNKVTDVLSFGDWHDKIFLGEVLISLPQARRQAKEYKVDFESELVRLVTHGVLHLAGYDHEKSKKEAEKMFILQDKILEKIIYYVEFL